MYLYAGEEAGEFDPKAFQLPLVVAFDLDVLENEILKRARPETVAEVREMTREVLTAHYSDEELRELRDIHLERVEKSAKDKLSDEYAKALTTAQLAARALERVATKEHA